MHHLALVVAMGIVLCAGSISGFTGFGFALVSVPLLLLLYSPSTVVVVNLVLNLLTNLIVVLGSRQDVSWATLRALAPAACAGLVAGIAVLARVDPAGLKLLASLVVVAFAALLLRSRHRQGPPATWMALLAGASSGFLSTATGIGGPPIVLYLTACDVRKEGFRASAAAYFLLINSLGLVVLATQGLVQTRQLTAAVLLVPVTFIGTAAGKKLLPLVSHTLFRTTTLLLVLLTGFEGAITATLVLVMRH